MTEKAPFWFLQQLAETIVWCHVRADLGDPEHCLRSSELQPDFEGDGSDARDFWPSPELIVEVVEKRHTILYQESQHTVPVSSIWARGRLLVSAYPYSNHNGATAHESDFFFNHNDVPPWDTWVAEVEGLPGEDAPGAWPPTLASKMSDGEPHRGLLVSWIPEVFIPVASKAIELEVIGMLCWADEPPGARRAGPRFDLVIPDWLRNLKTVGPAPSTNGTAN
jgi:hypothetical protein